MTAIRARRSALYVPGSNERALKKAIGLPADVVILDLEDAVAPDAKIKAREQVVATIREGSWGSREVVIRINTLDSPGGEDDLTAAAVASPDAILIPKVSNAEGLVAVGRRLGQWQTPPHTRVWAMIETALAILDIKAIAAAARDSDTRLSCLVMGTNDLAKETRAGLGPGRPAMLPWLMMAVAAARANGLAILDGVYNALADEEGFRTECQQGRECGFDGKTLIHPGQIAAANEIFAPSAAEVEHARAILAAFALPENAGRGAIAMDGRMVERLHAEMAQGVLDLANAIADRE